MASSDVTFTMDAQAGKAVAAFLQVHDAAKRTDAQLDAMNAKQKKGGQGAASWASSVAADIGKAAIAFAGVGTAMQGIHTAASAILNEYQRYKETRVGAIEPTVREAEAQREFLEIASPVLDQAGLDFNRDVLPRIQQSIAQGGRLGAPEVYKTFTSAISAAGSMDPRMAMRVAEETIQHTAPLGDPETTRLLAGAVLDVARAELGKGTSPDKISTEGLLGSLMSGISATRATDIEKYAYGLIRGVGRLVESGGASPQEAIAIGSMVSLGGYDPNQLRSGEALASIPIKLRETLFEFFQKFPDLRRTAAGELGKDPAEWAAKARLIETTDAGPGLIPWLQGDSLAQRRARGFATGPAIDDADTRKWLASENISQGNYRGEVLTFPLVIGMLDKQSAQWKTTTDLMQRILDPFSEDAKTYMRDRTAKIETMTPHQEFLKEYTQAEGAKAAIQSEAGPTMAMPGLFMQFTEELGKITGTGYHEQMIKNVQAAMADADTPEKLREAIGGEIDSTIENYMSDFFYKQPLARRFEYSTADWSHEQRQQEVLGDMRPDQRSFVQTLAKLREQFSPETTDRRFWDWFDNPGRTTEGMGFENSRELIEALNRNTSAIREANQPPNQAPAPNVRVAAPNVHVDVHPNDIGRTTKQIYVEPQPAAALNGR